MIALFLSVLATQDLLERARDVARPRAAVSSDRLDLRIGPLVDRGPGIPISPVALDLNFAGDLACGNFDLAASFRSVMTKNMREELLGAVVNWARGELTNNALVLACQMSPTVCDALKHYRVTAQDMLMMHYEQCRSADLMAGSTDRRMRASALTACLDQKQAQGVPLDEAMRQCRDSDEMRGLRGQPVRELDLAREVGDALGLEGDSRSLLENYLQQVSRSVRRAVGAVRARPTDEAYEKHRSEYAKAMARAVAEAQNGPVSERALEALSPAGTPPVTNDEVQRLLTLDAVDRDLVIGMLASATALARTLREAGDVRAALHSARTIAADPALGERIEQEAKRLDEEVRRLREEFELSEIVARSRLRADAVTSERMAERVRANTAAWRDRDRENAAREATREWSKSCPPLRK